MSTLQIGTAFLVGAAGLALWLDLRLGDRCPRSPVKVALHAAVAWVAVRLVAALATQLFDPASKVRTATVLTLLVLSGWIYAFLASIWSMKLLRSAMAR
jgi:hypothetical protein